MLLAAVVLVHALVLQFAARAPSHSMVRAPVIELRPVLAAAPKVEPAVVVTPVAAAPAPSTQRPAARPPKPQPARNEPVPTTVQATRIETPNAPIAPQPPTRMPPSTELVFALQHGAKAGTARLTWRADGEHYTLSLQATLPSGRALEQHSEGGFDAAGLAPLRLADRRNGRDVRAANFQREHGKVTFSGPRWELPLEAGTQDRLSWLLQLVALLVDPVIQIEIFLVCNNLPIIAMINHITDCTYTLAQQPGLIIETRRVDKTARSLEPYTHLPLVTNCKRRKIERSAAPLV